MVTYKAEAFLARCAKVRPTGTGSWVACCPAHEDKHPSMTVRETAQGIVLLHCFAGCSVDEILTATGMSFDALFPESAALDHYRSIHKPFPAADVLCALVNELSVVAMIAGDIEEKREVPPADMARLRTARDRIETGVQYALGLHLRAVRNVKR